jgi:hypothetical protein
MITAYVKTISSQKMLLWIAEHLLNITASAGITILNLPVSGKNTLG